LVAYSEVVFSVITAEVKLLLVSVEGCVNNVVSDMIVENVDAEIDDDVVVWVVIICVDGDGNGREELSVELNILVIVVVATSLNDEDVAYECDIVDDEKYSVAFDVASVAPNVFSLPVLEITDVVVEII
jgi:hypothetical protein